MIPFSVKSEYDYIHDFCPEDRDLRNQTRFMVRLANCVGGDYEMDTGTWRYAYTFPIALEFNIDNLDIHDATLPRYPQKLYPGTANIWTGSKMNNFQSLKMFGQRDPLGMIQLRNILSSKDRREIPNTQN